MAQPQICIIIPLGDAPGYGNRPDNSLPGGQGGHPSQPIYHPGHPDHGHVPHPDQGLPGNQPYPDQGLPGNQPYPDQGLPGGSGGRPSHPIELPEPLPPPPEEYADSYVYAVWSPTKQEWLVSVPNAQPK